MASPSPRLALLALALLAGCRLSAGGAGAGGGGAAVIPVATAVGEVQGPAEAATIGAEGGELASADGALRLVVPPGAVEGPTAFTATPISARAPGAVGPAWRLEASGPLAAPVTVAFRGLDAYPAGLGPEALGIRFQDARGLWIAPAAPPQRDAGAVAVETPHLSDWALVLSAAPALEGSFTYATTVGTPFTAAGTAALFAWPDAAEPTWWLAGTATLPPALALAGLTCTPDAATQPLDLSVAEVSGAAFRWGINARWAVTCADDATGARSQHELSTDLDTLGITHHGCARRFTGTQVAGPSFVQGSYLVDCGAAGQVAASWDFRGCTPGGTCVPADPCRAGTVACGAGVGSCVAGDPLPAGTACGDGLACDAAGACAAPAAPAVRR